MVKSKPTAPSYIGFTLLSSIVGLVKIVSPYSVRRLMRRFGLEAELYRGPLVAKINNLLERLDQGEIAAEQFVSELRQRYNEIDLESEFNEWIGDVSEYHGTRTLYEKIDTTRASTLHLSYISPASCIPPHAHHNLASAQCVLKGNLHVRQYDRIARLDPHTLTLRPVSDAIFHQYDSILTTEYLNNVHWFGTNDLPAVVLNFNVIGGFDDTFNIKGTRPVGRYYIDPTTKARDGGLIVAPEISSDEAHARFARHALSEFDNEGYDAAGR